MRALHGKIHVWCHTFLLFVHQAEFLFLLSHLFPGHQQTEVCETNVKRNFFSKKVMFVKLKARDDVKYMNTKANVNNLKAEAVIPPKQRMIFL